MNRSSNLTFTRIFFLIPLCLSAMAMQGAMAATIAVTSTGDDGPGSLRQALDHAANGDTINITARGTITLYSGELVVNKDLIIRGPGAGKLSVSAGGASRVFHVTPDTIVTISGITITNGSANTASGAFVSNAGGGIYSDHADLTVSNCTIRDNSARFGGGIFSNSQYGGRATLTVRNSIVRDNSASFVGGGIFSGGGFANIGASGDAILTVNSTSFSNNSARYGGGIFNDGFYGTAALTLTNSPISASSDPFQRGAAIYNNGDSGVATVTLTSSTVTGNPTEFGDDFSSGIHSDGTATVSPGSATLTITDSAVMGNGAFRAGAIANDGLGGSAIVTINNSTISDAGAGIFNVGGSATVNNSTLSRNGSGIVNEVGTLTVNHSTVSENTGGFFGGIYNAHGGSSTINNSTISGNSDIGVVNRCATLTINESTVSNSSAEFNGRGIENSCSGDGETSTVILTASTVNNNSHVGIWTGGSDGAVATFTLINSTVSGNSSTGIYTSGVGEGSGFLILHNSTLSGNTTCPGCGGGGIQNISLYGGTATVAISNTILKGGSEGINIGSTGTVISYGYNLSSDAAGGDSATGPGGLLNGPGDIRNTDPLLGPLKNNGGPTKTHALLMNSPAIDAGDPNFDPNIFDPPMLYDQRSLPGFWRVVDGRIDIGAFESKYP